LDGGAKLDHTNLDGINRDRAYLDHTNLDSAIMNCTNLELNDTALDLHFKAKIFPCRPSEATTPSKRSK